MIAMWWKHAVLYEVYVDKFAGTFANFAQKLDYLKRLGVDCIHLLPHYPSPMVDDGYDISDYKNVRSDLGTLDDFSLFVKGAHERDMKVMIDFVLNHTSTEHPWFREARGSTDNPKRNFYLWSKTGTELAGAANPFKDLKPNNWIISPETGEYYFSTFYPQQADLNWDNPEVFSAMMAAMDFWVHIGVDAFRLDAASHLVKREGTNSKGLPETHALLKKIRAYLDSRYQPIPLLAEVADPIPIAATYFGNGDECHLVYNFPMSGQLFLALARGDARVIEKTVQESGAIPGNCSWALFLRHHDEMNLGSLSPEDRKELLDHFDPDTKYRFGSGTSMRLATMLHGDEEKILEAYKLLFSIPGSPIIYYGDEISMENEPLPPGEKDTRKSVRGKFDWAKAEIAERDPESLFNGIANMVND